MPPFMPHVHEESRWASVTFLYTRSTLVGHSLKKLPCFTTRPFWPNNEAEAEAEAEEGEEEEEEEEEASTALHESKKILSSTFLLCWWSIRLTLYFCGFCELIIGFVRLPIAKHTRFNTPSCRYSLPATAITCPSPTQDLGKWPPPSI